MENAKNKELLRVCLQPNLDRGLNWMCSLRQYEHDTDFDGVLPLKKNSIKPSPANNDGSESQLLSVQSDMDILNHLQLMSSQQVKHTFHKRRSMFDQDFISEEDLPLQKRRINLTYFPAGHT